MKRKKPTKTGRTPKTEMDSGVAESKASALKLDSDLLIVIALFITSLIAFWSLSIEGRIYTQGDNINDAIFYQQVDQYHDQTGEIARWNPYIFGGVPNIFNLPKSPLTLDYYLDLFSSLLSLPFVFFWMGAVGLYLLLRYLKFSRLQSLFGSLIFLLSPFYKSLVINGHGTKIEAIMYAPWIFWALFRLMDKKRWLDVLFLALFAGLQIRTSHYQVVFYTAILSVIFVVSHTVQEIRKREKYRYRMIFMIGVAAVGAVFLSARPLYLAAKYAGESIRGRDVIRLSEQNSTDVDHGVDKRFVETWSFTPGELMTLLVPRAMGGTSSEYYGRARSIGFRQDVIPGYWGHSPYNGSYYYLGAFIFFLLLIPVLWIKENPLLWQFIAGLILMMIWSLGTFAGPIYDLSYSIVPFFSNFRTPTTSLAMVYLMATILAVYGLSFLPRFRTGDMKKFWTIIGIGAGVTALFFLAGSGLSFANVRQNYQQNVLELLTEARRSMFFSDLMILACSLILFGVIIYLFIRKKMDQSLATILLLIFSIIDLGVVWSRYGDKPISRAEFNRTFLADSETSELIKGDQEVFRVFAMGGQNYSLPVFAQMIGGGYDMQMNKSFYEVATNCLHQKIGTDTPINWNVLDFMNVKYVVSDRAVQDEHLSEQLVDAAKGLYTYRYKFSKDRGFFVDEYQVVRDPATRLKLINSPTFDVRRTAILEEYPVEKILPASRSTVDVISFDPNKVVYTVETSNTGLFVMSEIYQPDIQKVFMDGEEIKKVFKTDHTIQSVVVPEGIHTIEIRYEKSLFTLTQWISNISFLVLYLLIGMIVFQNKKEFFK